MLHFSGLRSPPQKAWADPGISCEDDKNPSTQELDQRCILHEKSGNMSCS
jgi:hypothetical protein